MKEITPTSSKDEIISSAIEITDLLAQQNRELKEQQTVLLAAVFTLIMTAILT